MKFLIIILLAIFFSLQYKLWLENDGVKTNIELHQAITKQDTENQKLTLRNQALEAQVEDLKHGHDAVEELARSELGMIRNGETFYQVIDNDQANKSS